MACFFFNAEKKQIYFTRTHINHSVCDCLFRSDLFWSKKDQRGLPKILRMQRQIKRNSDKNIIMLLKKRTTIVEKRYKEKTQRTLSNKKSNVVDIKGNEKTNEERDITSGDQKWQQTRTKVELFFPYPILFFTLTHWGASPLLGTHVISWPGISIAITPQ